MKAVEQPLELSEDMEVVGPGQMLADARKVMKLSQEEVAERLNFRITLVNDIESEKFDSNLPETFNRGYLRNYAKLVGLNDKDILLSYQQLNIAKKQEAELQSFSKGTEKQAETNLIMWVSYLILAALIASSAFWWSQQSDNAENTITRLLLNEEKVNLETQNEPKLDEGSFTELNQTSSVDAEQAIETASSQADIENESNSSSSAINSSESNSNESNELADKLPTKNVESLLLENAEKQLEEPASRIIEQVNPSSELPLQSTSADSITEVVFSFSGDCWVNISDATGERIAWGVKKQGYVMTISGQAPFRVTLGRPELVDINFAGTDIEMSQFNAGNIAKFNLPIEPSN